MHIQEQAKILTESISSARTRVKLLIDMGENIALPKAVIDNLCDTLLDLDNAASAIFGEGEE